MPKPFWGQKIRVEKRIDPAVERQQFTSRPIDAWITRVAPAYSQESVALAACGLLVACMYLLIQIIRMIGN